MRRRNIATPHARLQPVMASAPMAFHASPVSASQLPVYNRPAESQSRAGRGVKRIFVEFYSNFNMTRRWHY